MYMYIGIPIANARTGKKETRRAIWVSALVQAGVAVGREAVRGEASSVAWNPYELGLAPQGL